MATDLEFVKYKKRKTVRPPKKVNFDAMKESAFANKKKKEINLQKINAKDIQEFYEAEKPGQQTLMSETQQARMFDGMSPFDLHNVEVLTYKMIKLASEFEAMWKASGKVKWTRLIHAFMIESLNGLSDDIQKVQKHKQWPIIWIEKGKEE